LNDSTLAPLLVAKCGHFYFLFYNDPSCGLLYVSLKVMNILQDVSEHTKQIQEAAYSCLRVLKHLSDMLPCCDEKVQAFESARHDCETTYNNLWEINQASSESRRLQEEHAWNAKVMEHNYIPFAKFEMECKIIGYLWTRVLSERGKLLNVINPDVYNH